MRPVELEGARRCAPYHQGDLDGFCGLYAVINALRVAVEPGGEMTRWEAHELFVAGLTYLNRKSTLHRVGAAGMSPKTLHRLAVHLAASASQVSGTKVTVERPALRPWKRAVLLDTIDSALQRGAAVIIGLGHSHDHFTVVVGATEDRYTLCDSGRLHSIARESLGTTSSSRRHRLGAKDVLLIRADAP